jgi:hypothetical protein
MRFAAFVRSLNRAGPTLCEANTRAPTQWGSAIQLVFKKEALGRAGGSTFCFAARAPRVLLSNKLWLGTRTRCKARKCQEYAVVQLLDYRIGWLLELREHVCKRPGRIPRRS